MKFLNEAVIKKDRMQPFEKKSQREISDAHERDIPCTCVIAQTLTITNVINNNQDQETIKATMDFFQARIDHVIMRHAMLMQLNFMRCSKKPIFALPSTRIRLNHLVCAESCVRLQHETHFL